MPEVTFTKTKAYIFQTCLHKNSGACLCNLRYVKTCCCKYKFKHNRAQMCLNKFSGTSIPKLVQRFWSLYFQTCMNKTKGTFM